MFRKLAAFEWSFKSGLRIMNHVDRDIYVLVISTVREVPSCMTGSKARTEIQWVLRPMYGPATYRKGLEPGLSVFAI
jgi:hypothetical protein